MLIFFPNFFIKPASSCNWASLGDSLIILLLKSNSIILESNFSPPEKMSLLASLASLAKSDFLIVVTIFLSGSAATLIAPVFKTSITLVVIISPIFLLLSLKKLQGSFSFASRSDTLTFVPSISFNLTVRTSPFLNFSRFSTF